MKVPMIALDVNMIPSEWRNLLMRVQAEVPAAILAGGCLRDRFLWRTPTDLDIFVPASQAGLAAYVIQQSHPELLKTTPEPYMIFDNDVRIVEYWGGSRIGMPPVNLVGVTDETCTAEQQINRFDFGLCQIAFQTSWQGPRIITTPAFEQDVTNETFTITRAQTDEQLANTMQRFERLSAKYEGWTLVPYVRPEGEEDLF